MTTLQLVATPVLLVHKPTRREGMQFTAATWLSLDAWLAAELGTEHYSMTESGSQLVIHTTQGDSRDCFPGGWVLKRPTRIRRDCADCDQAGRQGFEFYPVEPEVVADDYDLADGAA